MTNARRHRKSFLGILVLFLIASFLPACGKLYPSSLVKIAVIGQETLRWGWDKDGLAADFRNWKEQMIPKLSQRL